MSLQSGTVKRKEEEAKEVALESARSGSVGKQYLMSRIRIKTIAHAVVAKRHLSRMRGSQ